MAAASGIELLRKDQLNPLLTSTYGTGEMILHIINEGIRDIIIGIGGSATVDGGAGMLQALGFRLLNSEGENIPLGGGGLSQLSKISTESAHPELKNLNIRVACDVTNPLLGKSGAAAVFGPQKGAKPQDVEELEVGLGKLADLAIAEKYCQSVSEPGDGAAGGLGMALRVFLKAKSESGAELVLKESGFNEHIKGCHYVITGEGCTDSQTLSGKLCAVVAQKAKESGVPTILLSGALKGSDHRPLLELFHTALSIDSGHITLESAISASKSDLEYTASCVARLVSSKDIY
ncbi:MAG: glycerate kinase [Planctomycetes bacterium]|nr:glycerate kinase [Planctomycetota bacterium]